MLLPHHLGEKLLELTISFIGTRKESLDVLIRGPTTPGGFFSSDPVAMQRTDLCTAADGEKIQCSRLRPACLMLVAMLMIRIDVQWNNTPLSDVTLTEAPIMDLANRRDHWVMLQCSLSQSGAATPRSQ